MARSAVLWLCVCANWMVVCTGVFQYLNLHEGDVCKQESGTSWTCTHIKRCPTAIHNINHRHEYPEICGIKDLEIIACCKPERKSKQMCRKYADTVFTRLPDPLRDGGVSVSDTCSLVKPKTSSSKGVIGGTESRSSEYSHMALLGYGNETSKLWWSCGGSLISDLYVLTSALCAHENHRMGPLKRVRLGHRNIQSVEDDESRVQPMEFEVIEIIVHPEFTKNITPPNDDIALLKLNTTVNFTEYIRPICLQTEHELPYNYGIQVARGRPNVTQKDKRVLLERVLLTSNITIVPNKQCEDLYNTKERIVPLEISDAKLVCAGGKKFGKDACWDETGAPLQVPLDDPYCSYSQVGISSFRYGCGTEFPGVYTRVSNYVTWIEHIVWP